MPLKRDDYEVKLELFEGPLDLLLYLVNKSEVNIVDISVAQVVAQYLEYLDLLRELNIDVAAEYLHMAATLVRLKARELLPPGEGEPADPEEDGIYNRDQLIEHLFQREELMSIPEIQGGGRYPAHLRGGTFRCISPRDCRCGGA